jgi:hypothetical protein
MSNNRKTGKRWERMFANQLRDIFPDIRRNAGTQSQSGGRDLENTGNFAFEVKGGKMYKSRMIRRIIDQTISEKGNKKYAAALIKPLFEDAYVILPFKDFVELLRSK